MTGAIFPVTTPVPEMSFIKINPFGGAQPTFPIKVFDDVIGIWFIVVRISTIPAPGWSVGGPVKVAAYFD